MQDLWFVKIISLTLQKPLKNQTGFSLIENNGG